MTGSANRLFVQVFWGQTGNFIRSFGPEDGAVRAQARDDATVPVWGTPAAEAGFVLAEPTANGFRVHVPDGGRLERDGHAVSSSTVQLKAGERWKLTLGESVVLLSLEAAPAPIARGYHRAVLPVLVLIVTFIFPIYFLIARHSEKDSRRVAQNDLWREAKEGMPELILPGEMPPDASRQTSQTAP